MRRRLPKETLLEHAEARVDGQAVQAAVAARVSRNEHDLREVEAMSHSLRAVAACHDIVPTAASTERLFQAARQERIRTAVLRQRNSMLTQTAQGFVSAAAVLLVAGVCFYWASQPGMLPAAGMGAAPQQRLALTAPPRPDAIEDVTQEIQTYASALRHRSPAGLSAQEWEQRQRMEAIEQEWRAALSALERQPGNPRARDVVRANLHRTKQTLRDIYANQSY